MKNQTSLLLIALLCINHTLFAALQPMSIPRSPSKLYRTDGLYEGGSDNKANLEGVRLAPHEDFERWVIDFSDDKTRTMGATAPKFQIRYLKADQFKAPDGKGTVVTKQPARFIFIFRSIQKNFFTKNKILPLVKKSHYVKDIIIYPQIEMGDMAMEFVLKDDVAFNPHQPVEKSGRLVVDMKPRVD